METISILISIIAVSISLASYFHSRMTRKENRETKHLEIWAGLRKELVKNKITLLSLFDFDYDRQLFTIISYDFIDGESEVEIPDKIVFDTAWWDVYSNEIKDWHMGQFNEYLNIYEKIQFLKNKKNQKLKANLLIDILEKIDDIVNYEFKILANYSHIKSGSS